MQNHQFYMQRALDQARRAFAKDEVPIGAVIVNAQGAIIARAFNRSECNKTQTAHAEMLALQKAGKAIGDWRLQGCWIYVTLEPCAMCLNAIVLSRVEGLVYGAQSPLFGYHKVDKDIPSWLYKRDNLAIIGGVHEEEAKKLLQQFFKQKREQE